MMLAGDAAIDHLARQAAGQDSAASSHWRKYHEGFRFSGEGFEGLQGFGGHHRAAWHRELFHKILQRRFRRMAEGLPFFPAADAAAAGIAAAQGRDYDLDLLRQALTVAFLKAKVPGRLGPQATVCVIGDGLASMSSLLLSLGLARRVLLVNLSKTLLVDLWYLRQWMGAEAFAQRVSLASGIDDFGAPISSGAGELLAIEATRQSLLGRLDFHLAINIASMQEMDPPVIAGYFAALRVASARVAGGTAFYCCNREEKILPDGTVTRIGDYPWREDDEVLVDELCPWHQVFYGKRPPFYRPYDGPVRHRLAVLAQEGK
jgi:hypothetical protein